MRALPALVALCLAGAAAAQVRPMPTVDDGSPPGAYPYREVTSTADIRPEALARAAREADLRCAGPKARPAAVSRCRRARIAAEQRRAAAQAEQDDYADRAVRLHTRAAACQAGDPDACY